MAEDILKKLLKKILSEFVGPEAEKLVDLLYKKQNVNEFIIAKKLNMTINQTRNMLYKLADEGLVQFVRKKDKKKGGWYTYFWTLKIKRSLMKYKEKIITGLENLNKNLQSLEKERHYHCKNCDLEYTEENALLHDYTCPECGETLDAKEIAEPISHIKNSTKKLRDILTQINQEIANVELKEEKTKGRRLKAEQKQKELERKKKRNEREREKMKLIRKNKKQFGKKFPKKKINKHKKKRQEKKSFMKKLKSFSRKIKKKK